MVITDVSGLIRGDLEPLNSVWNPTPHTSNLKAQTSNLIASICSDGRETGSRVAVFSRQRVINAVHPVW